MDIPWDEMMLWIEEKRLVPIIGQDLLMVETEEGPAPFYEVLARRVADDLKIPRERLPANFDFNDLLATHLPFQTGKEKIHAKVKLAYDKLLALPIPQPLRQLARIKQFKLFVTTTFDDFLTRALNEERHDGAPRTLSLAYSHRDNHVDLSSEMLDSSKPIVFQLLGKISSEKNYALTDCDLVEFTHSLHARGPARLLEQLGENNLLLLGNSFPPWIWRSFLRTAKNQTLYSPRQKSEVVIDRKVESDPELKCFIESFSNETTVCDDCDAVAFVAELSRRCQERFGVEEEAPAAPAAGDPAGMEPGSVFVSYSSADRSAVEVLCRAFEDAKIDAWFDRQQLKAGDDWERKLRQNVRACSLFIPIISESVVQRASGRENFRDEWGWALERLGKYTGLNLPFIVPVVIDDTQVERAEGIPEEFTRKQAMRVPDGTPTPEFIGEVRRMVREIQRRENRGA